MSTIPSEIVQGDSASWTWSDSDYPASTWSLTYYFAGEDRFSTTVSGTPDGDAFDVEITPAISAAFPVGPLGWQAKVTDGTDVKTVATGRLEVRGTLQDASAGEVLSHAERTLAAIEAVLEDKATKDQLSYSIGGRSLVLMSPAELLEWRSKYRVEVKQEERARKIAAGESFQGLIFVRWGP